MSVFPTAEHTFTIPGPSGALEIMTAPAKPLAVARRQTAIICHPHPLFGGTMNNKVVATLARTFAEMGMTTVRFNFRGVGLSGGAFADGIGEQEDLLAVIAWLRRAQPLNELVLAGFSFGAAMAAHVASTIELAHLVTVAPPVPRFQLLDLPMLTCPWLIVQGESDEIVAPDAVYAWAAERKENVTLIRIPNASHFFHGQLLVLREQVSHALSKPCS